MKMVVSEIKLISDDDMFHGETLTVRLVDEGGGNFFEIEDNQGGTIRINPEEIDELVRVKEFMLDRCGGSGTSSAK